MGAAQKGGTQGLNCTALYLLHCKLLLPRACKPLVTYLSRPDHTASLADFACLFGPTQVWDFMEANDIARFPRPVHHRIPNVSAKSLSHQRRRQRQQKFKACLMSCGSERLQPRTCEGQHTCSQNSRSGLHLNSREHFYGSGDAEVCKQSVWCSQNESIHPPQFVDAEKAADNLAALPEFQNAKLIKGEGGGS